MTNRDHMEASKNAGTPPEGSRVPALQRIDQQRVARIVRDGAHTSGLDRLRLMVGTIIPRLEQGGPTAGG